MKRVAAIAETASRPLLWAIGLANLLFAIAFMATLLLLAGEARAQAPACTGANMLEEMERATPGRLAELRAEAAKSPNGRGLLWRIEKAGVDPSYLFGTMHMTDPRVVTLTPEAQAAFDASTAVVIETMDVLDPSKMMAIMTQAPDLMMFTDGTTLSSLLEPEHAQAAAAALAERGMPMAAVDRMKPWVLSAMVALPVCEVARKSAGLPILDVNLANEAKKAGKTLGGLETGRSQLEAMASLPMDFHMEGLVETLKLGDRIDDMLETMIVIYETGETGLFWPFFQALGPESSQGGGYAAFEEVMITKRNAIMAREAMPYLDRGGAFIAVGALHLPGDMGLVEELRRAGYSVTPAG